MTRKPPTGAWVRRPLLAQLTLLVGVFCVFSQFSGAMHWALVEHARCAEHGDWVHPDDEHGVTEPSESESAPVSVVASTGDQHGHDHCQFLADRRELPLPPLTFEALNEPPARVSVFEGRTQAALGSGTIYELAPKTSPPV